MSTVTRDLGKVSVTPKGTWNSQLSYSKYDIVSYNGGSYIGVANTIAAGVPITNPVYWQVLTNPAAGGSGGIVEFSVDLTTQMRSATSEEQALGYYQVVENLTSSQKEVIEDTDGSFLVLTTPLSSSSSTAYPYVMLIRLPYYTSGTRFITLGYGYTTMFWDYDASGSKLLIAYVS